MVYVSNLEGLKHAAIDMLRIYTRDGDLLALRDPQPRNFSMWQENQIKRAANEGISVNDGSLVYTARNGEVFGTFVYFSDISADSVIDDYKKVIAAPIDEVYVAPRVDVILGLRPYQLKSFKKMQKSKNVKNFSDEGIEWRDNKVVYVNSTGDLVGAIVHISQFSSKTSEAAAPAAEPAAATLTQQERLDICTDMTFAYDGEGYKPPAWSNVVYTEAFDTYAHRALLVIDTGSNREIALKVAREREPVNIDMGRHYKKEFLATRFGYAESGYTTYFNETGLLAPNIGVYTYAPVLTRDKQLHEAHIYNAIGVALDNVTQVDYVMLANDKPALIRLYVKIFNKIYATAKHLGLKRVVISLVGANNFAMAYGIARLQRDVWVPALKKVVPEYPAIKTDFLGGQPGPAVDYLNSIGASERGDFPAMVPANLDALIVNAWDPHSMPGNGNFWDRSLDGWIGRTSAIHFFGWAISNPFLEKNILEV